MAKGNYSSSHHLQRFFIIFGVLFSLAVLGIFVYSSQQKTNTSSRAAGPVKSSAYFIFTDNPKSKYTFVILLNDPVKIQQARNILSGKEKKAIHIMGKILTAPKVYYNRPWHYYLDPNSVTFFDYSPEVCDAGILYIEQHLKDPDFGKSLLPNYKWCPWRSKLLGELKGY